MSVVALIPAYNPSRQLVSVVRELSQTEFAAIVVVNDGSSRASAQVFAEVRSIPKVHVLLHAENLGKGAALKTGLNYVYCHFPESMGVVTIDADGQHLVPDACRIARAIAEYPRSLVLGARSFDKNVPLRSMFGNVITKYLFRVLIGHKLNDTQSGLRGIPRELIPNLLKIESGGYEFELDMLLVCKYGRWEIREIEIATVYINGNESSHFNPLLDSLKIYFVLFRFALLSLVTACIDYTVFILAVNAEFGIAASQLSSRLVAMTFNYSAVKRIVFYSDQSHIKTLPKYVLLVAISGSISLVLIDLITAYSQVSVIPAKIISELIVFLANFAIQRDFIFTKSCKHASVTDWDKYYRQPFKTASITRRITERRLHKLISGYVLTRADHLSIGELGGGNSCFYDGIQKEFQPAEYHVYDNNETGLVKFKKRHGNSKFIHVHCEDVLDMKKDQRHDFVFSVGLIEHFSKDDTKRAISAHFDILKPGGIAVISYPTPTILYKISRRICELSGMWIFHDERPLYKNEVEEAVASFGRIVYDKIIWQILLTQRIVVVKSWS